MKSKFKKLIKFTNDFQRKEDIVLRDHLSMERTKLANERTLLSYVRTSLYLVLSGIAFLGMEDFKKINFLGYYFISIAFMILITGIARFYQLKRHVRKMYEPLQQKPHKTNAK